MDREISKNLKNQIFSQEEFECEKLFKEDNGEKAKEKISLILAGVGPGDPSLVTIGAIKAIQNATLIAYPVSIPGGKSIAAEIASDWISPDKKLLEILFPMVTDSTVLKKAWNKAVEQLINALKEGEKVVFLSLGDTSLFSTASYVLMNFKKNHPEYLIKVIPGVNSFSAAAAICRLPLALQKEQLLVLSTPEDPQSLQNLLVEAANSSRVVALLKIGGRWEWMRPLLEKMNLLESSLFAQKIGFSDEQVLLASEVPKEVKPYFSLLLVRQSWPAEIS